MKRIWAAALGGTLCGLFAAGSVVVVGMILAGPVPPALAGLTLAGVAALLPVLLPPAVLLAWWFEERRRQGRSRGSALALGFLVGIPLGMVGAVLAPYALLIVRIAAVLLQIDLQEIPYALAVGIAGGAGTGLGTAWIASRPPKEPA